MSTVYLGLGSNLGNRLENLKTAISEINRLEFTSVDRVSSFYFNPAQDWAGGEFLNAVIRIYTLLCPFSLLVRLQKIEKLLGRVEKGANAPRTIDIDILLYDDLSINSKDLVVPHPKMWQRDFVLLPLGEIALELKDKIDYHCKKLKTSC